jgi:hypothetical protein
MKLASFLALCFTQMSLQLNLKLGWISCLHSSTTFLFSNYLLGFNIFLPCFTLYVVDSSSPFHFHNHSQILNLLRCHKTCYNLHSRP